MKIKSGNNREDTQNVKLNINFKYSLSIDCPTSTYDWSNKQLLNLHVESSYHVIPSIRQPLMLANAKWQVIANIIKQSQKYKQKILDICFPYMHLQNQCATDDDWQAEVSKKRPMARYLILNGRLLGIKIDTSDIDQKFKYRLVKKRLPLQILQLNQYKNLMMQSFCNVGDFYLTVEHKTKMAVLFEGQINLNQNLLKEHYAVGCEIFSVIDTLSLKAKRNKSISKTLYEFLKKYNVVGLYTGFKIVISPTEVYWTNVFLYNGSKCLGLQNNSQSLRQQFCRITANLQQVKLKKTYNIYFQNIAIKSIIMQSNWRASINYEDVGRNIPQPINESKYFYNCPFSLPSKRSQLHHQQILYIWYLFKTVNKCNPFILSIPFSSKSFNFALIIDDFISKNGKVLSQYEPMLIFYQSQPNQQLPLQLNRYKIYQSLSQLTSSQHKHPLYFYCGSSLQLKLLQQAHQSLIMSMVEQKLQRQFYICQIETLNDSKAYPKIQNKNFHDNLQNQQTLLSISKNIVKKSYNSLEQLLNYLQSLKLKSDEVQWILTKGIPKQIRVFMKPNQVNFFFINNNEQNIIKTFGDIQIKKRTVHKFVVVDDKQDDKIPQKQSNITDKLSIIKSLRKKYQQKSKKNGKQRCHRCSLNLQIMYGQICLKCRKFICLQCSGLLLKNRNTNQSNSQMTESECVVCLQLCDCSQCKVKKLQAIKKYQPILNNINSSENSKKNILDCQKCQILNRVTINRKQIYVSCNQCSKQQCYYCFIQYSPIKQIQRKMLFEVGWICQICKLGINKIINQSQSPYLKYLKEIQEIKIKQNTKEKQLKETRQDQIYVQQISIVQKYIPETKKAVDGSTFQKSQRKQQNTYQQFRQYQQQVQKSNKQVEISFGGNQRQSKQNKRRSRSKSKFRSKSKSNSRSRSRSQQRQHNNKNSYNQTNNNNGDQDLSINFRKKDNFNKNKKPQGYNNKYTKPYDNKKNSSNKQNHFNSFNSNNNGESLWKKDNNYHNDLKKQKQFNKTFHNDKNQNYNQAKNGASEEIDY